MNDRQWVLTFCIFIFIFSSTFFDVPSNSLYRCYIVKGTGFLEQWGMRFPCNVYSFSSQQVVISLYRKHGLHKEELNLKRGALVGCIYSDVLLVRTCSLGFRVVVAVDLFNNFVFGWSAWMQVFHLGGYYDIFLSNYKILCLRSGISKPYCAPML